MSSEKQRLYIANIIITNKSEYRAYEQIANATPLNNDKYPDTRANYQQLILTDNLKGLTSSDANYIIKAHLGQKGYRPKIAYEILSKLNLDV